MSNYECRKKASMLLKHRYGEGFFAVMIIIGAFFLLKIFDIAQIGLLLYNNGMDTKSLFHSSFIWELILKLCSAFITLAVMTPLITGGLWWFYETASGGDSFVCSYVDKNSDITYTFRFMFCAVFCILPPYSIFK